MAKRSAGSDLNHDNWDQEDKPEEAGSFSKASDDALKKRTIKVARRRVPFQENTEEKVNAFGGFSGFGKPPPATTGTAFGFLTKLNEPPKTNGTPLAQAKDNLDEYYAKLKGLNQSVAAWIHKHVQENALISLQPVFKDYDKYMADLDELRTRLASPKSDDASSKKPVILADFKFGAPPSTADAPIPSQVFSFGSATHKPASASPSKFPTSGFSFGSLPKSTSSSTSGVSSMSGGSVFGGDAKPPSFSFSAQPKPAETVNEEDEPPKVEFTPVVEEGHVYTTRCKVFVKKDGAFGDRGVGNLYLKPVADSDKMQLIVRADTNLGNLLCNFILSKGIPMQRLGKKDVMMVCIPTPDSKPPPVPVLFRVNNAALADDLLKVFEKYQK